MPPHKIGQGQGRPPDRRGDKGNQPPTKKAEIEPIPFLDETTPNGIIERGGRSDRWNDWNDRNETMSADKFFDCKGQFIAVEFTTVKAPRAEFKGTILAKRVRIVARAGVDYANLSTVREGITNGERGEVQPLAWGEWERFPYTITHKGERYFRLYPVAGSTPTVIYTVNGETVDRDTYAGFLTPSERAKMDSGDRPDCITVKAGNCTFPATVG